MKKFVFSTIAVMTAVALSANPLKGWMPTNGNQLKTNPGSVKVDGTSITLKGNKSGHWYFFKGSRIKSLKGQDLVFTFTASGKGKVMVGCYEYSQGYSISAQQDKAVKLSNDLKEHKIVLKVKSDKTTILAPRIVLYPGSEIKITKFECEITGKPAPKLDAVVNADRPDFMYKVGETAHFTVEPKLDGKVITEGTLTIYPIYNGFPKAKNLKFDLAKGPVKFDATMDKPGFYRAHIAIQDKTGKFILKRQHSANVAAAFSPEEIKAGRPAPADLITYWYGQYDKMNKEVPADFKIVKDYKTNTHHYQWISFANFGGTRSYCTIAVPLNAKGKLPMVFTVPPAGNYGWGAFKRSNAIQVTITVFDRLFPKHADYMAFNKPWYYLKGAQSRETYYYYKAILGMMRMMDYAMKNVKEWDGKHLAAVGRSQGGGSAFILAALNPKIQCVSADVPAMCDHNAYDAGRRAGWPQVLRSAPNRSKNFDKDAEYFDAANFAAFVKCPALVTVGFYDSMCEPMSVYAAYNNLKGEKKMLNYPRYGHGWGKRDESELNRETEKLLKAVFAK